MQCATEISGRVPVWGLVVRSCHWVLAALVLFDLVHDDGGFVHRVAGYVAVGVVLLRLAWGAVARGTARLRDLRPSVSATMAYVRLLKQGHAPRSLGHDPLGLWMVWLLWLLVLLLGVTGWCTRLDKFWGDENLKLVHAWLAHALEGAALLHLAGVALMSWLWQPSMRS